MTKEAPRLRQFLRMPALEPVVQKKKSWIYNEIKEGRFPRAIILGKATAVWDAEEVAMWQEAQMKARDEVAA